jgi:transcriptional regulator with XRE-family HTH domain
VQSLHLVGADEDWRGLASALRLRREQLRLTQQALADRAQVGVAGIKTFESGKVHSRYPATLTSVAIALGWTPDSPRRVLAGEDPELVETAARDGRTTEQWLRDAPDLDDDQADALLVVLRALRARHPIEQTERDGRGRRTGA